MLENRKVGTLVFQRLELFPCDVRAFVRSCVCMCVYMCETVFCGAFFLVIIYVELLASLAWCSTVNARVQQFDCRNVLAIDTNVQS